MAERLADPAECVAVGLAVLMGVDLQSDGQPGVTENDLSIAGRDAEVLQQRRGRVPQTVDLDMAQAMRCTDAVEGTDQVSRLDWAASSGPASGGDDLVGMAMDFDAYLGDDVEAEEDPGLWQNMDVQRHPGAQWLITGRATGRRQDADAIGAELARIWENDLRYRHRAGHTIETAPGHVTLRAVTQIAAGGLWVTATVQVDLA